MPGLGLGRLEPGRSRCWPQMRPVWYGRSRGRLERFQLGSPEARALLAAGTSGAMSTSLERTPGASGTSLTFHSLGAPSS